MVQELGAAREQTVAIGDGANDLKMMAEAGAVGRLPRQARGARAGELRAHLLGLDGVVNLFE